MNALSWIAWTGFEFCTEYDVLFTAEIKFSRIGDVDQRTVTVDTDISTIEDKVQYPDFVSPDNRHVDGFLAHNRPSEEEMQ